MATNQLDSQIRALIDQFTAKFRELLGIAALGSVQMALEAGVGTPVAPARRGPGRPRGRGKARRGRPAKSSTARGADANAASGRRVRRSAADVEEVAEQVHGYVLAHPGQRLEEIGRGLGTDTAGLKLPIKELVLSGRLRTVGQKRGTKYFADGKNGGGATRSPKGSRKAARRAARRKAGKRGKRKAVRQVALEPAKKGRRSTKRRRSATKARSAVAE